MAIVVDSYIHYHYINSSNIGAVYKINTSKELLLAEYMKKLNTTRTIQGLSSISANQLFDVLEDFSSSGPIGQKLENSLKQQDFWDNAMQNSKTGMSTNSILSTGTGLWEKHNNTTANVQKKLTQIHNILNNMVEFLYQQQRPIVLSTLIQYVGTELYIRPEIQKWLTNVNNGIIKIPDNITSKTTESLQTLKQEINQLYILSGEAIQTGQDISIEKVISAIAGCFRNINGEELFEDAVAHGANSAFNTTKKAFKSLNDYIYSTSNKFDEDPFFKQTGDIKDEVGESIKADIQAYYKKNGVVYELGGTIKLRQSKKVQIGSLNLADLLGIKTINVPLIEAFLSAQKIGSLPDNSARDMFAILGATYYDMKNTPFTLSKKGAELGWCDFAFEEVKNLGMLNIMLETMFGKGGVFQGTSNLASWMLINNKVVTFAQIYQTILSQISFGKNGGNIKITPTIDFIAEHDKIRRKTLVSQYPKPKDRTERSNEVKSMINTLLQTKISITISNIFTLLASL